VWQDMINYIAWRQIELVDLKAVCKFF
jgi:hypothetical protein